MKYAMAGDFFFTNHKMDLNAFFNGVICQFLSPLAFFSSSLLSADRLGPGFSYPVYQLLHSKQSTHPLAQGLPGQAGV